MLKGLLLEVISGVRGNARALCTALTTLLGVGGTVHAKGALADVEVQGEQADSDKCCDFVEPET